jgi:hypothetical protein
MIVPRLSYAASLTQSLPGRQMSAAISHICLPGPPADVEQPAGAVERQPSARASANAIR